MDLTTMQAASESTRRILGRVTPADYDRATPCQEWDVRALLNHLVGTLFLGAGLLSDTKPTVNMMPGSLPDADLVGKDPAKAYEGGVAALLPAAAGDALARSHSTPLGDMPGAVLGGFTTLDIAVHGWDLAKATGQDAELDDALAEAVFGFARQAVTDAIRGPGIGPAVAVGRKASLTDQLMGYLGRQP